MATLADSPVGKPLLWIVAHRADRARRLAGRRGAPLAPRAGRRRARRARRRCGSRATRWSRRSSTSRWRCWPSASPPAAGSRAPSRSRRRRPASSAGPAGSSSSGRPGSSSSASGAWHVHKGVTKHFLKQIDTSEASPSATRLVTRLGQIGFPGKGIALAGVGGLLIWAAVTFDPSKAHGPRRRAARGPRPAVRPDPAHARRPGHRRLRRLLLRPRPLPRAHLSRAGDPRSLLDRVHGAVGRAREVTDHPVLTHVARVGLIAYGAMHLLIG